MKGNLRVFAVGLALYIFATQCSQAPTRAKQLSSITSLLYWFLSCWCLEKYVLHNSISLAVYCLYTYFLADQISCRSYVSSAYRMLSLAVCVTQCNDV